MGFKVNDVGGVGCMLWLVCWSAGVTLAPPGRGQILGTDGPSMGRGEVKSRGQGREVRALLAWGSWGCGGAARQSFVQLRSHVWWDGQELADWQIGRSQI